MAPRREAIVARAIARYVAERRAPDPGLRRCQLQPARRAPAAPRGARPRPVAGAGQRRPGAAVPGHAAGRGRSRRTRRSAGGALAAESKAVSHHRRRARADLPPAPRPAGTALRRRRAPDRARRAGRGDPRRPAPGPAAGGDPEAAAAAAGRAGGRSAPAGDARDLCRRPHRCGRPVQQRAAREHRGRAVPEAHARHLQPRPGARRRDRASGGGRELSARRRARQPVVRRGFRRRPPPPCCSARPAG